MKKDSGGREEGRKRKDEEGRRKKDMGKESKGRMRIKGGTM